MSSKQDRTWARTAADLERKQNFREVLGIATDARTFAEEAKKETKKVAAEVAETNKGVTVRVEALENGIAGQFSVTVEGTEDEGTKNVYSLIDGQANKIRFKADSIIIQSTKFTLNEDGSIKATEADITGTITAEEGSFGQAHIKDGGTAYGKKYNGFYFGIAENGTFFGINDDLTDEYRSFIGLGLDTNLGVLITNADIQKDMGGADGVVAISWGDLIKGIKFLKDTYPNIFQN